MDIFKGLFSPFLYTSTAFIMPSFQTLDCDALDNAWQMIRPYLRLYNKYPERYQVRNFDVKDVYNKSGTSVTSNLRSPPQLTTVVD